MTNQVMLERPALESNDALLVGLFIASIIHVVIILGVNFNKPDREEFSRSIEITIVNTPAKKAPKDAKTLAQENQVGAGEQSAKPQLPEQKIATVQHSSK
ncbi:MAG: energy transducer TonB, partial [Gammaproteobacteria bacterium]